MKPIIIGFLLTLPVIGVAQNSVCFTIDSNPNTSDPALAVFSKYVDVFGCSIYAESTVADEAVLHAAAVWAELIDNDEDGIVDDPLLLAELQANDALMPIFETDGNAAMTTFENNYVGDGIAAVLWETEIDPAQTGYWGADATVEEILHTINAIGHVNIYPAAFDLSPNSSILSAAMDSARGGQFLTIPAPYPASAWYHYDDATCDYECMLIEYMYWMEVTNMGILNDVPTCSGIANEWEPCSPALLQSTDVLGFALITDPVYKLPQLAPDGNYCPSGVGIEEAETSSFQLYPNPALHVLNITRTRNESVQLKIRNQLGQVLISSQLNQSNISLDLSGIAKGIYFVQIGIHSEKLVIQ
jgi:hypothetical protein